MTDNNGVIEKGNFYFIADLFPEVYSLLSNSEKQAKIDLRISGKSTRDALEVIVNRLIL